MVRALSHYPWQRSLLGIGLVSCAAGFLAYVLAALPREDPDAVARDLALACIDGQSGSSVTFECTGTTFNRALAMYLKEHPGVELAGIASLNDSVVALDSRTTGFQVIFRALAR